MWAAPLAKASASGGATCHGFQRTHAAPRSGTVGRARSGSKPISVSADPNFRKRANSVFAMGAGSRNRQLTEEQARKSPVRARILELHEQDPSRSLAPDHLHTELCKSFDDLSQAQIAYHLRWLHTAGLIPHIDTRT